MPLHGIITGDIVASKKIKANVRQQLFADIDNFLKLQKRQWISTYETFRGDSLQCEAKSPELALRIALMVRAYVKSYTPQTAPPKTAIKKKTKLTSAKGYFTSEFDIRVAVGIGTIDFIQKNKISSSDGQAFRLSGEGLDMLKNEPQRLAVKTLYKDFDEQMEPSILLLDALMQKWTQKGAELVLHKLQNKKEEEIATLLNISQPAVNQRKKNAQWQAIEKLIQYFEKTVQSW